MIGGNLPNLSFQTFYVSKEESNCPLISQVIKVGKKLIDLGLLESPNELSVSLRYGKHVLINSENSNLKEIKREDFLEIIDYDPLKKVILLMGPNEPRVETPIHWLIHHSRNEVNAVIQINEVKFAKQLEGKLPETEKEYPLGSLEQAKEILRNLRDSKMVIIKNQGVLFVGNNIREVENEVLKVFEELK